MDLTYIGAPIVKHVKDPDTGYLTVYGKLAGPELDLDGQICDPAWLAKAVPDWFNTGANVRVSHTSTAVGKGIELEQAGDSWNLKSLIVDRDAIAKIEADVLTSYSIGIKNCRAIKDNAAPGGRIVGGSIVESSIADRPCNPTTKFVLAKMAGSDVVPAAEWAAADDGNKAVPAADLTAKAAEVTATVKTLIPDLAKAADDETSDIAGATQALALIARLIQSEAEGLAAGQMGEAYDIECLLDAVSALRWFCEREAMEPSQGDSMDLTTFGVSADVIKAATADDASDEAKAAPLAELRKALGVPDDVVTKSALADTLKEALEGDRKVIEERLAKVEEMAAPGGPARTRSQADAAKTASVDRLQAEADRWRQLAGEVTDPALAAGYRAKAAMADKELATLP
jgi:hypothetical protein